VVIQQLVLSTAHLPDQFTASGPSYMDRDTEAENSLDAALLDGASLRAETETDELRDEINAEIKAEATRTEKLQRQKPVSGESSTDEDLYGGLGPVLPEIKQTKTQSDQEAPATSEQADTTNPKQKKVRGDSDSDMASSGSNAKPAKTKLEREEIEFKKPDVAKRTPESPRNARAKTINAVDIAYIYPAQTDCVRISEEPLRLGVLFRQSSYAIKGESLSDIDKLVALYKKCGGGKLVIVVNLDIAAQDEDRVNQLRQDEIKYYLLQRRVDKEDMLFPDKS